MLRIGQIIETRDGEYRVEAIGVDWVIIRKNSGDVDMYKGEPEKIFEYYN